MTDGIDVLHIGSACRDVDDADPRGWRLGGGVTYAALTTGRLGVRTAAVVGVDREARGGHEFEALRAAGVDLLFVPLREGPIFHNVETPAGRVQTCIQTGVPLPVPALPESWLAARAWSIVPVAAEVDDRWAGAIPDGPLVALAWQGLLRRLVPGQVITPRPPRRSRLIERADFIGVSHHDLPRETRISEIVRWLHPGARMVVTRGGEGGLIVEAGHAAAASAVAYHPTAAATEVDPTGAGDTFLAALLASAVRPDIVRARGPHRPFDLGFAAAVGSLAVEGTGLAAVPDLAAVRRRMRRLPRRAPAVAGPDEAVGRAREAVAQDRAEDAMTVRSRRHR